MKKIYICLLGLSLLLPLGCGTFKKITGWGSDEEKQTKGTTNTTTTKIIPPPEKVKITSTTAINWVLYSAITVAILFAIRYGVKKATKKKVTKKKVTKKK
jgi:hypothetical protein